MTKFQRKLDELFWFIVAVLPILIYFISNFHATNVGDFSAFIEPYRFDFISDIFNQIFTDTLTFPEPLVAFLSYFVSVEIIHIFIDAVVLLPRFVHKLLGVFNEK